MRKIMIHSSENRESYGDFKRNQYMSSAYERENLQLILRKKRSKRYMKIVEILDMDDGTCGADKLKKLTEEIKMEFLSVDLPGGEMIGIVAKCYLGHPYEVHTLDLLGNIVVHYKTGESLPDGMEKARRLAKSENYAFVEVYNDCLRAINHDGIVSVIKD